MNKAGRLDETERFSVPESFKEEGRLLRTVDKERERHGGGSVG